MALVCPPQHALDLRLYSLPLVAHERILFSFFFMLCKST